MYSLLFICVGVYCRVLCQAGRHIYPSIYLPFSGCYVVLCGRQRRTSLH